MRDQSIDRPNAKHAIIQIGIKRIWICKILKKTGKRHVAGIARTEYDSCFWKQRRDQAKLEYVVRHFIDHAQLLPPYLTDGRQIGRRSSTNIGGAPSRPRSPANLAGDFPDPMHLSRATYLRMAGGDLFHQRGPGTRIADDENRNFGAFIGPWMRRKGGFGKHVGERTPTRAKSPQPSASLASRRRPPRSPIKSPSARAAAAISCAAFCVTAAPPWPTSSIPVPPSTKSGATAPAAPAWSPTATHSAPAARRPPPTGSMAASPPAQHVVAGSYTDPILVILQH